MARVVLSTFVAALVVGCYDAPLESAPHQQESIEPDGGSGGVDGGAGTADGGASSADSGAGTADSGTGMPDSGMPDGGMPDSGMPGGGDVGVDGGGAGEIVIYGDGGLTHSLMGLTWNSTTGVEEVRAVDPNTGLTTWVANRPEIGVLEVGGSTYDSTRNAVVLLGSSTITWVPRLFSVDATSGALLGEPLLALTDGGDATLYNWSGGIHVRNDGVLVGATWDAPGSTGDEELRELDPALGVTQWVSDIPTLESVANWADTYDAATNSIFIGGNPSGTGSSETLFQVDATTGALVASWSTPFDWGAIHFRADHVLIGVLSNGTGELLLGAFDPSSGVTTAIGPIQGLDAYAPAIDAYDATRDVLYLVGVSGENPLLRLFAVDATSGAVLANPFIDPVADAGAAYNWSGGMHVVVR